MSHHGLRPSRRVENRHRATFVEMWWKLVAGVVLSCGAVFAVLDGARPDGDLERAAANLEESCERATLDSGALSVAIMSDDVGEVECLAAFREAAIELGMPAADVDDMLGESSDAMRAGRFRFAVSESELRTYYADTESFTTVPSGMRYLELADCSRTLLDIDVATATLEDPGISVWSSPCDDTPVGKVTWWVAHQPVKETP